MRARGVSEGDSQRDGVRASVYRRLVPVCQDSIGTTWLGAVVGGPDSGRQVLLTVIDHGPDSLMIRPLLAAASHELKARHSSHLALLDIEVGTESVTFVGEALEGEPLSTLIAAAAHQEEQIPSAVALRIVREAVLALRSWRKNSPIPCPHGLLNPETIFVASCGEVLLRQPCTKAAARKVAGYAAHPSILPYTAPEVLMDEREDECCADVFSAGVLLWEMIAGRGLFGSRELFRLGREKAFSSGAARLLKQRVINEPIPDLSTLRLFGGAVSSDISRLVHWMLVRDPAARPQSLDELIRAFDALPPTSVAEPAEVGRFVHRLLSDTFEKRNEFVAHAVAKAGVAHESALQRTAQKAASFDALGVSEGGGLIDPSSRLSSLPEPRTVPRAVSLAARLAEQVPPIDEEPPPAAVVSIDSSRGPVRRDGLLAAAAGLLLVGGLGGYLLLGDRTSADSAATEGVIIDEARHRVGSQKEPKEAAPQEVQPDSAREAAPLKAEQDEQSEESSKTPRAKIEPKAREPEKPKSPPSPRTGYRPSGI